MNYESMTDSELAAELARRLKLDQSPDPYPPDEIENEMTRSEMIESLQKIDSMAPDELAAYIAEQQ